MKTKAVFLDRDGTLIIDKVYLNDPEQIEYLPDVFAALRLLRDDGYKLIVVTNQSGLARGLVQIENLHEIHDRMSAEFARQGVFFAGFYYAPYSVESNHFIRKPNPGMLLRAAHDHNIELSQSWMVGDRMTDVEAGHRAGVRSVLIDNIDPPSASAFAPPQCHLDTILEAAQYIVNNRS